MERYLVTGGAGFIGSHIVEALLRQGQFVRVIDNFDTGSRENVRTLSGEMELIEGEIQNPDVIAKAMDGIDYVFHEAARGSVPRSVADPLGTHESNVTGTISVLDAARQAGVKRVVCASSSSVYGESEVLPKVETMQPDPRSPYAMTKLMLEHYCRMYSDLYGLEAVALRYFNIYGARQNPLLQYAAVIPIFIKNMLDGKPCVIYGDGEQTRDFTYVEDCVQANLLACKAAGVAGQAFNIACGEQTSVNDLFAMLGGMLNYTQPAVYEPPRAGDVKHSYAGVKKASNALSFRARTSLEEGLRKTIESYR